MRKTDFKGLNLGEPIDQTVVPKDWQLKCWHGANGRDYCEAKTTIAGVHVTPRMEMSPEGALEGLYMTFGVGDFQQVFDGLSAKFGKPTKLGGGTVQNMMGASASNRLVEWNLSDGSTVMLTERVDMSTSMLNYFTPSGLERSAKRRAEQEAKQNKDL